MPGAVAPSPSGSLFIGNDAGEFRRVRHFFKQVIGRTDSREAVNDEWWKLDDHTIILLHFIFSAMLAKRKMRGALHSTADAA